MNDSKLIAETASFHLDEDVLPGAPWVHKAPYRNHGRHIVRNRAGIWICSFIFDRNFRDRNWLALSMAQTPESEGDRFYVPILLVGREDVTFHPLFEYQGDFLGTCCLLMDGQDGLHVVYETPIGIFLLKGNAHGDDPQANLSRATGWSSPEQLVAGPVELGDAVLLPDGRLTLYFTRGGGLYEQVAGGEAVRLAERGIHPSVFVEPTGTRHVAFDVDRRIFYARTLDGKEWTDSHGQGVPEMVAYFCSSWPSLAVSGNGKVVIAYQGEGKVDLKREPLMYPNVRPAGGSTVSYAVLGGDRWHIWDFLRSSEILLKRTPASSLPGRNNSMTPVMEEFWRPSLAADLHGVIWMFYLNTTRRHIYFTRFQGETFSDHFEARGPFDCLSRVMLLQKDSCGQPSIGFLTLACNQLYFDRINVPQYASDEKRRVVFLDNLEVAEAVGLEHQMGVWEKHPTPIFGAGISGDSQDDHVAWCEVVKADGGFEMRYMGMGQLYCTAMNGRAFSHDGIHWEKRPPANISHWMLDGQPFTDHFWRPIFLEDPSEKDPSRRFKGLWGHYRHAQNIELRTWEVVTSPDGVAWRRAGLPPVCLGDISVQFHLLCDEEDRDPQRRYKVLLLKGAAAGRCVCVFTSPDLLHWERVYSLRENPESMNSAIAPWPTGPIAIDPDAGENPWEEEIHDAVAWRENRLLMFHYDAFYFASNQHIQKALAVSRDGKHYWRIKRGAVNMSHGNCGEWDNGRDRTSPPIRVGDELWLYFVGMPAGNFTDSDRDDPKNIVVSAPSPDDHKRYAELRPWRVGLAKLRVDGWSFFRLGRDAVEGHLTTVPFDYHGGVLQVNGCGLGQGGVCVEWLTADGKKGVPGFEREKCRFSQPNDVNCRVDWEGATVPTPGRYCLRFVFEGLAGRLYSFGFESNR